LVFIHVRLIKATLVPVLTYGGEIWGMSDTRAALAQRVLNRALRSLVRLGDRSSLASTATLSVESGIAPISAMVSAARARAYTKYRTLRTVVSLVMNHPPPRVAPAGVGVPNVIRQAMRRQTWLTGTPSWMRRYCPEVFDIAQVDGGRLEDGDEDVGVNPGAVVQVVRRTVWTRMNQRKGGQTLQRYMACGLDTTSAYIGEAIRFPMDAMGVHWLMRARVNAIWTGRQYVRIRWLPEEYRTRCPFCDVGRHRDGETLSHMLVECPRWADHRLVLLQTMIDEARRHLGMGLDDVGAVVGVGVGVGVDEVEVENLDAIATYLLGGRCGGSRCEYWVRPPRQVDRQHLVLDAGDPQDLQGVYMQPEGAEVDLLPGFMRVARFFSAVVPARQAVLGLLLQPPRADANDGRAALVQVQGQVQGHLEDGNGND